MVNPVSQDRALDEVPPGAEPGEHRPVLPVGLAVLVLGPLVIGLLVAGLFAYLAWKGVSAQRDHSRQESARAMLQGIRAGIQAYESRHGSYPPAPNAALVRALRSDDGRGNPIYEFRDDRISPSGELLDTWQAPIVYEYPAKSNGSTGSFRLYSRGPNGVDENGQGDDILVTD